MRAQLFQMIWITGIVDSIQSIQRNAIHSRCLDCRSSLGDCSKWCYDRDGRAVPQIGLGGGKIWNVRRILDTRAVFMAPWITLLSFPRLVVAE